ncbi:hypothetical protein NN561_006821 [Cricetulus griseus]
MPGKPAWPWGWVLREPWHVGSWGLGGLHPGPRWVEPARDRAPLLAWAGTKGEVWGPWAEPQWTRPRGMRWAEPVLEPAELPSWAGPNGQRKPPLARSRASPALHKCRREPAHGTAPFVPGRLQNSGHTFHMCTPAPQCPPLSALPTPSGCDLVTRVVSIPHAHRVRSAASFLPAPPNPPDLGKWAAHEPPGTEGVGTGRAVGGATLRSVRARGAASANGEPPKPVKSGKGSKEGQEAAEAECSCLRTGATELEMTTEKH